MRVRPAPFEPAHGLLGRLAVRHGYSSTTAFVAEMALGLPDFVRDVEGGRRLAELAILTGISEAVIRASTKVVDGNGAMFVGKELIHPKVLGAVSCNAGRVCPDCLRADLQERDGPVACRPHRRIWWDLAAVTACPLHGVPLIDKCPACGAPPTRGRASPRYCGCGCDLAEFISALLDPSDLAADRYLVGRLGGVERSAHPVFDRMPFQHAAMALLRIGRVALAGARGLSFKGDKIEPADRARMASLGYRMSAREGWRETQT